MTIRRYGKFAAIALLGFGCGAVAQAQQSGMTFFVTSTGSGKGADFGGLSGADKHCQSLATAAGAGNHTWRAYLSASPAAGAPAVNARERIGNGPWQNVKGVVIARDVAELHGNNNLNKQTALTEKGEFVNGSGDSPNMHDILTGSQSNGMAIGGTEDRTCRNWTSSGAGAAMVGHHDRLGLSDTLPRSPGTLRIRRAAAARRRCAARAARACCIASR